MQLDKAGQAALLKLSEIDLGITKIKAQLVQLVESKELADLQAKLTVSSGELLTARTEAERLSLMVRRSEEDIRLVEERLARDTERLNTTSSPKDAQAIEREIESLKKRMSDLEDVELNLLSELEASELVLAEATSAREALNSSLTELQNEIQNKVDVLKAEGRKLTADRQIVVEKITPEVLEQYQRLSARQIAVGQVDDRGCTACRINLTVGAIENINSLPENELAICPDCQAFLVR
jgi:predicted  nucleic acid-binding Zn-ribbon protein